MTSQEPVPPIQFSLPYGPFEFERWTPSPALAGMVARMSGYRENAPGHYRQREPVSLVVPIVISFGTPFGIGLGKDPGRDDRYDTFLGGLSDRPVVIDSFGASHCLQVDFTPQGARRFFGIPMCELTNRVVSLDSLIGGRATELRDRLGEMSRWTDRFSLAEAMIRERIEGGRPAWRGVAWAYRTLVETNGEARIGALAERLDCSRRHLVAKFREDIGLPPKTLARIIRFQHVLERARLDPKDGWADVAADCGYADQSHLSREFHQLAGETPSAWGARQAAADPG